MFQKLKAWWLSPVFPQDKRKTYEASLLNPLVLSLLLSMGLVIFGIIFVFPARRPTAIVLVAMIAVLLASKGLINRGYVHSVKVFFVGSLWLISTGLVIFAGGADNVNMVYYVATTVVAALLFGRRGAWAVLIVTMIVAGGIVAASFQGWLPPRVFPTPPQSGWLMLLIALLAVTTTLGLAIDSRDRALQDAEHQAAELELMFGALRQSEQKYRALFDAVSDALILIDRQTGAIVETNCAVEAMYGYASEALIGQSFSILAAEVEPAEPGAQIPQNFHRRKDGAVFAVEITSNSFQLAGRDVQIAAVRDVSQQKEMEARERAIMIGLGGIALAADELIRCETLDELYRRAVELGREKLGLERCSVWLLDDTQQTLFGTYGTDMRGRTADERAASGPIGPDAEILNTSANAWKIGRTTFSHLDGEQYVFAEDHWYASTLIRSAARPIGIFFNDAAITKSLVDEARQEA